MAYYKRRKIVEALELEMVEIKVFHDRNYIESEGHSWLMMTKGSAVSDLQKIYQLEKELKEIRGHRLA